jgi:CO/xanthine dehydrogenase Mo-binding subunit
VTNKPTTDGRRADERPARLDRREALQMLGGVIITFTIGEPPVLAQYGTPEGYPTDFNAFVRIGENGRITCFTGKIEMGQGVMTSLPQMLADELDVDVASIDMVMGDTALCPPDFPTVGSRTTKYFGVTLRRAGAEARAVLLELAAERLKTPTERLVTRSGAVHVRGDASRRVTYAELARGRRIERSAPADVPLKKPSEHRFCGHDRARSDAILKVTGAADYAGDIRLPGMLHARLLRPPAHGATLVRADLGAAKRIDGVRVVEDGDLIAVLHERPDSAQTALESIDAEFETPELEVDNDTIFDYLVGLDVEAETVAERGKLEIGGVAAASTFEATYLNQYVAHAPLETHTAVAEVRGDAATVWASTQAPFWVRATVAAELDLPEHAVRVITPYVGGGFGGKTRNREAVEAARLARIVRRPVMVEWTRAEEFFFDSLRPAAVIKVRSGLTANGKIAFWDFDTHFAGARSSNPVYEIAHLRVRARGGWRDRNSPHPFAVGAWRGPGSNSNVFAMESHLDVMAAAAGIDPLTFRFEHLADQRMKRVLEAAAEAFGKAFAPGPSGRGRAIVCADYHDTYVAAAAEIAVDPKTGAIRVDRIVCAQDLGEIINPEGATLQVEGALTMGLGYALSEEVRFTGRRILDRNFDTYEIPRFSRVPRIETVLLESEGLGPQGCGEPPITVVGGLLANAVFDAVGARVYELPMTPERVRRAVEKQATGADEPAPGDAAKVPRSAQS